MKDIMVTNKEKQERNKNIIIGILIGIIIGISIGVFVQQIIMIKGVEKIGESMEGVVSNMNIEVDINETKVVEATYELMGINWTNAENPPEINIRERH